jgi:hypothetical protein
MKVKKTIRLGAARRARLLFDSFMDNIVDVLTDLGTQKTVVGRLAGLTGHVAESNPSYGTSATIDAPLAAG